MFKKHPEIAKRWVEEYGSGGDLPEKVSNEDRPSLKGLHAISKSR